MKRKYPSLQEMRNLHGINKEIPATYEEEILTALSHFPELQKVKIRFVVTDQMEHPLLTKPSRVSLLASHGKRRYTVKIAESADGPLQQVLLKSLPYEARIAAVAHELARVTQFEGCTSIEALKIKMQGADRTLEREADAGVIEHGLGFELYTHASYICKVPGLLDAYHYADVNRLNPNEILEALPPDQLHDVHRF